LNDSLEAWILEHPNVTKTPHRFGGTEYQVQGLEFMHSHGPSYLDIRLSKEDQEQVLKEKKAEHHRFAPQAGWVTFRIHSEEDAENVKALIQLAYDHADRLMTAHKSRRSEQRTLES
jgi:ribosome-associated translation inhibitor RaiA